eukprot:403344222
MTPADYLQRDQQLNDEEGDLIEQDSNLRQFDQAENSSSFYSASFKDKLVNAQLQSGFNMGECKQNYQAMQLQQLLHNEKSSPEILPYQGILVDQITKLINQQEIDVNNPARDTDDRFFYNIHRMELERQKYMLKSYLRTRLLKIERHSIYIIEKDLAGLLSEGEMSYVWNLQENKKSYFQTSMFNRIPTSLNPFEKEQLEDRMITLPNEKEFVFVRFFKDHQLYTFTSLQVELQIQNNCIYFLPYDAIKEFLEKGEAELL